MEQSHVLISPVNAIRISIAQPFFWDALGAIPHFVRGASELRFFVAFSVVALMTLIFIGVIQTIVVSIADVNSRNTVAVITSEQIAETCSTLGLAVTRRLVASVQTIIISVAIPSGWDAPVIRTSEAVLGASSLGAMNRILIAIVTAIVIAVAQPVRLHADVCLFAFEMI